LMSRSAFRTRFPQSRVYCTDETRRKCLSLMRATAQSVSVITTVLPTMEHDLRPVYHGATLSSFASIAMYPQPFVSFSLRTPSRMAESLHREQPRISLRSHMVINLLSASQAHLALRFSRQREDPFASTDFFLSPEGIPILHGCLGALSCTLVGSVPLGGYPGPDSPQRSGENTPLEQQTEGQVSELFVARVLRVEKETSPDQASTGDPPEEIDESLLPLVYHRQKYVTVDPAQSLTMPCTSTSNSNKSEA
ncbi:flavin reductase like domain-containing protein, partial [Gautieria morchelliformis]